MPRHSGKKAKGAGNLQPGSTTATAGAPATGSAKPPSKPAAVVRVTLPAPAENAAPATSETLSSTSAKPATAAAPTAEMAASTKTADESAQPIAIVTNAAATTESAAATESVTAAESVTATESAVASESAVATELAVATPVAAALPVADAANDAPAISVAAPVATSVATSVAASDATSMTPEAAQVLANQEIVADLIARLHNADADVAREAALALGATGSRAAVDELVSVLANADGFFHGVVRSAAAASLAQLKDCTAVPVLTHAVRDPMAEASAEAVRALATIGDERAVAPLAAVLRNADGFFLPVVRLAAAKALKTFDTSEARKALMETAANAGEDSVIRAAA
jgi:epidermal growth factor receptor substrate 15